MFYVNFLQDKTNVFNKLLNINYYDDIFFVKSNDDSVILLHLMTIYLHYIL